MGINGEDAKNKKNQTFVIADELVSGLREHLKTIQPGERVFNMDKGLGAEMMYEDLKAANIDILDSFGRTLDFHCLRYTYCTELGLAGVEDIVRQELMRHSSRAVMKRYEDTGTEAHAEALARLQKLDMDLLYPERRAVLLENAVKEGPFGKNARLVLEHAASLLLEDATLVKQAAMLAKCWNSHCQPETQILKFPTQQSPDNKVV